MTPTLIRLLLKLNTLIPYTLTGLALAGSCRPKEQAQQFEDPYACANRPSRNERWACEAAGISFPTVECLTQDIITYGDVRGKSYVFNSMSAKGNDASNYAQQGLNGRGVMFHMALDRDYIFRVLRNPKFRIIDPTRNADNLNRQDIYVRKLSQALPSVCEGDAFLMVL